MHKTAIHTAALITACLIVATVTAHAQWTGVGTDETQTVTNKTIDADSNTITNIENADIKAAAAIDAAKVADGSVSNTEYQYINGATSAIQTQLDGLTIGADVQAYNAYLADIAGIAAPAQGDVIYFDGTDWVKVTAATAADGDILAVQADGSLAFETSQVNRNMLFGGPALSSGSVNATEVIIGNYIGYSYDIADDSAITLSLPPDYVSGTNISVVIRWYINEAFATGSGEIQWNVAWSAVPADGTEAADAPTHSGTLDSGDENIPATAKYVTETTVGTISAAGLSVGDQIGLDVERVAIDTGANPTADPVVLTVVVLYTAAGSGD